MQNDEWLVFWCKGALWASASADQHSQVLVRSKTAEEKGEKGDGAPWLIYRLTRIVQTH